MKKNLATAMAAAMAFGAVVPAFANEIESRQIVESTEGTTTIKKLDVRPAINGYKLKSRGDGFKIFNRNQAFNTNFTDDVKDDTLKFKDAVVIKEFKGKDENKLSDYQYVIGEKATAAEIELAKAELSVLRAEIEKYKSEKDDNGKAVYTIDVKDPIGILKPYDITDSNQTVQLTNKVTNKITKYVFEGIDEVKSSDTITSLKELFDGIDTTLNLNKDNTSIKAEQYYKLNKLKYVLESNVSKLDVVKSELNSTDLELKIYKKDTKSLITTFKLTSVNNADSDLLVNMPAKGDFKGHWAEKEIVEAMLRGNVVATDKFRTGDGITRAEFSKMVCEILNIPTDKTAISGKEEPFHDVSSNDWHYKYIVALYNYTNNTSAKQGAIINGYGDTFKPNAPIKREEAAKMIASAYEIQKKEIHVALTKEDTENKFANNEINNTRDGIIDSVKEINGQKIHRDIKTKFKDDKDISNWADEAVAVLSGKGSTANVGDTILNVIKGNPDGTFKPQSEISRAEALVTIMRAR